MKIAVRMDDITPDMDWKKFYRAKEILDNAGIKPLIGIVPLNEDQNLKIDEVNKDYYDIMRSLQQSGWVIALHGWHHKYTTSKGGIFPLNKFSEFAGVPYDRQLQMISEGRAELLCHDISTDIFMAPGHSYDKHTLKALRECGFTKITDGFGSKPYTRFGLTFYPISFLIARSMRKIDGYTTLVLHTNTMRDSDFELLESRVRGDNLPNAQFISYKEYLEVPSVYGGIIHGLYEWILATFKRVMVKLL